MKYAALMTSKYNKFENVIMVSSFPDSKNRSIQNLNAVASYADHLVPELNKNILSMNSKLIVFAELLYNEKPHAYLENDVLIYRCWKRNSPFVFLQLLKAFSLFNNPKSVFIQFEFNMFGKSLATIMFLPFLLLLRIKAKQVTLLLHQVLLDLSKLSGHINLKKDSLKTKVFNFVLRNFYYFCLLFSTKIIVHEQLLKDRLLKLSKKHVYVIPHGLGEYVSDLTQTDARTKLNIKKDELVILCFGFITWYKGSDWIVEHFSNFCNENKIDKFKLIMAGGQSANLKEQPHYKEFYSKVQNVVNQNDQIELTGFVADDDVPTYFKAANFVILPYRTQMSASGPLAIAIGFEKPFLLSNNLTGVLQTPDVSLALSQVGISSDKIMFDLEKTDLFEKIFDLYTNKDLSKKVIELSSKIKQQRQWNVIAKKFAHLIIDDQIKTTLLDRNDSISSLASIAPESSSQSEKIETLV